MNAPDVVMYSTGYCSYCAAAKGLLNRKGIAFRELRIDEDPAARQEMLTRSGGQRSVPQIFIGERHVGGFDQLHALDKSGELDALRKSS